MPKLSCQKNSKGKTEEAKIITSFEKAKAFMLLARQSPNYKIMLGRGFQTLANFVEACDHYTLTYSDLDEAVRSINELSRGAAKDTQAA